MIEEGRFWRFSLIDSINPVDLIVVVFSDDRLADNVFITILDGNELKSRFTADDPAGVVYQCEEI